MTIFFDRSRAETFEHCPRERYLGYEFEGRGIQRIAQSFPQTTGKLLHEPLAMVLAEGPRVMETAIEDARLNYEKQVAEGVFSDYFDGDDSLSGKIISSVNWQVEEQLALLEALVRGWVRVRYPALIAEFDVVDVEREERFAIPGTELVLLARCDAVLRRKGDGELFILNFKSTSEPNKTWQTQWMYDNQTISEVLAVEARLGKKVSGVLIEGLVKGKRNIQHPKDSGNWRHNSPLVYGWKRDGLPFTEYAARYEYKDEFGKTRRLGTGYQRFFVPEEMPIPAWLETLEKDCPEVLRTQFINLPAILRSDYAAERWVRSTALQEASIRAGRDAVDKETLTLDEAFPMHTAHGNCLRPGQCQFFDICHGMQNPHDTSLFKLRGANHPAEVTEEENSHAK